MSDVYRVFGSEMSPYSIKVRSYFRYKQIPHAWLLRSGNMEEYKKYARLPIVPAVATPEDEALQDSTPIMETMEAKFPELQAPASESICYATTNRQEAVKAASPGTDLFLIVGAPNSSNSKRLVEVALKAGARQAVLVEGAGEIPFDAIPAGGTVALSAGASAPEVLVNAVIDALRTRFDAKLELVQTAEENELFPVMRSLRETPLTKADMAFVNGVA